MRGRIVWFALLIGPVLGVGPALAVGPGMYVCPNVVRANDLDGDFAALASAGVSATLQQGRAIATNNGCEWIEGSSIRPIGISPTGTFFLVTSGPRQGWVSTRYFVFYETQP